MFFGLAKGNMARFPLTAVKVDRSFVTGMDRDERKRSIARAIVSMGHSLGLRVVAEGVETEAEQRCLVEDGCDQLQGYLLGRPVPPNKLILPAVKPLI
jgi:EAL domain-containing protein (putative c-di-GMP-specific phosphodiesterase class I)